MSFMQRIWSTCMHCGEAQWWLRDDYQRMSEQPCSLCGRNELRMRKTYLAKRDVDAVRARRRALLGVS